MGRYPVYSRSKPDAIFFVLVNFVESMGLWVNYQVEYSALILKAVGGDGLQQGKHDNEEKAKWPKAYGATGQQADAKILAK